MRKTGGSRGEKGWERQEANKRDRWWVREREQEKVRGSVVIVRIEENHQKYVSLS